MVFVSEPAAGLPIKILGSTNQETLFQVVFLKQFLQVHDVKMESKNNDMNLN